MPIKAYIVNGGNGEILRWGFHIIHLRLQSGQFKQDNQPPNVPVGYTVGTPEPTETLSSLDNANTALMSEALPIFHSIFRFTRWGYENSPLASCEKCD